MIYTVVFDEDASDDVSEISEWYEKQRHGLGEEFIYAVEAAVFEISRNPFYQTVYKSVRRKNLRRFPYSIFYSVKSEIAKIHVVMHASRNPKTWKKRL